MTIGEVAKAAGMSASAIRFYEASGILPKPERRSGVRAYDASVVDRLQVLRFYRACGVSIESLATLFQASEGPLDKDRHAIVQRRIAELEDIIRQARAMKKRLQALTACTCNGDMERCVIFA